METKELIAELRKHGLSNGGSLGWHSGLCDEAADRLESRDKLWKITRLERDQARQMRERAERLLAQAQGELLELRRNSEPVVHAHWEVVRGVITPGGDPLLRCPRCRSRESEHLGGIECNRPHWNYCPHCGAHMDEEVANV